MFTFFKKRKPAEILPPGSIKVDMHSHLLPGIDDGSPNMEESISLIKEFSALGYQKLITTPHIMSDFYRNTPEIILGKLKEVQKAILEAGIDIQLEAAAEYYLDEGLMRKLETNEELLTFGDRYLLFETSFMNPSAYLSQAVFAMQSQGYKPVLAHPERYVYLHNKYSELLSIREKGVLLQVNINSLSGYYSKSCQKVAEQLIEDGMVAFLGSDCHGKRHLESLAGALKSPVTKQAYQNNLLNNLLL